MYQKAVLPNGLRIVTAAMPHTRSVSLCFFIGTGSRYEAPEDAGISHFVEHMCFKGTERYPTARDISDAIEGVGGILNGGTDKELTIFWCKVARPYYPVAVDVLSDMLLRPRLDASEMAKERRVIVEEINMVFDSPSQRVSTLMDQVLWPRQALGREVAGSKSTVGRLSRKKVKAYLDRQYVPGNTVVTLAGDIEHGEVVESLSRALEHWEGGSPDPWYPADDSQPKPKAHLEHRDIEQVHMSLALRGLPIGHPQRFALALLDIILGEGMSSRLFQEVREKRGLAYDISSFTEHFRDTGSLIVSAGVHPQCLADAIGAIIQELVRLKEPVPEAELSRAKAFSKGRLLLQMEDSRAVAAWLGSQELLTGKIRTVDEIVSIIDSLTAEELQQVAQKLIVADKLNLAVVGPVKNEGKLANLLRF